MNDNLDINLAIFGAINNTYIKYIRQAYKDIINIKLKEFKLIEIPNPFRQIYSYLSNSYKVNNPVSYFKYFIKNSKFDLIITNTNKYTD